MANVPLDGQGQIMEPASSAKRFAAQKYYIFLNAKN